MSKPFYVDSSELEDWWVGWDLTNDPYAWEQVTCRIYRICSGITRHFHPRDEEEAHDHISDAFTQTIDKIWNRKLVVTRGRAPVFNLVTTTVFRILYSKMNKQRKQKERFQRYYLRCVQEHAPEFLHEVEHDSCCESHLS